MGRSRGGLTTKIHALTDANGLPLELVLTPGQAADCPAAAKLLGRLRDGTILLADKAYDADRIRERLSYDGVQAVIPPIPTRARKLPYDHARYRERNRIERFFNKLKHFRRIATRYDKLAKTFFAALCIVSAFILVKNS